MGRPSLQPFIWLMGPGNVPEVWPLPVNPTYPLRIGQTPPLTRHLGAFWVIYILRAGIESVCPIAIKVMDHEGQPSSGLLSSQRRLVGFEFSI